MKLTSLLNKELIKFNYDIHDKDDAISMLVNDICKEYKFELDKSEVIKSVYERESLGGTVFETGISIPHARLENFNDIIIAVCVPNSPVRIENIDVKMFVLILTSKASSKTYLQALSAFARVSQNKDLFNKLVSINSKHNSAPSEFIDCLSEIKIRESLTIEDIMTTQVKSVSPGTTLKELADLFYKNNISYSPVIDDLGNFIGEVTPIELIRVGIPNYAMLVGNLKFLATFEPFEELLKNEDKITVRDIMTKPSLKLEKDSSIIEASLELTQNNKRHLPVVENNKIIGIVSFMDVLKKVIRS